MGPGEVKKMLAAAKENERRARAELARATRARERAEELRDNFQPMAEELRKRREANHYTETFTMLFGGKK